MGVAGPPTETNVTITRPRQAKLELTGPAGLLEGLIETDGENAPVAAAVVCHPHPMHGGTMQNKVTHTLARSFVASGFAALRFNFRSVGASEGSFDNGVGEVEDALAVAEWLRGELPGVPTWYAGFSFGAAMAINAAVRSPPDGIVSIAPAVSRFSENLASQPDCPWLILQGDEDELVDIDETIAWINTLEPGPDLHVLTGAEHFFHGRLVDLRGVVEAFVAKHSGQ